MRNKAQGILNPSVSYVFSTTVKSFFAKMGAFYSNNWQILQFLLIKDKATKNKVQEILDLLFIAVLCVTVTIFVAKMGKTLGFINSYAW